jgi:hypothetical protein
VERDQTSPHIQRDRAEPKWGSRDGSVELCAESFVAAVAGQVYALEQRELVAGMSS